MFANQASQMTLTENNDVIQALAPDTADEPLADGIGFGRTHGRFEDLNRVSST
ncbi:MAG: hypothetical protein HY866_07520 [Chloroflexi bacterium]|nr:hypothetical protein [Chloroflexota bacterium]